MRNKVKKVMMSGMGVPKTWENSTGKPFSPKMQDIGIAEL